MNGKSGHLWLIMMVVGTRMVYAMDRRNTHVMLRSVECGKMERYKKRKMEVIKPK
jgi:hypothetical protein